MARRGADDDAFSVTVVPDSSVAPAAAAPRMPEVPGYGRSRSRVVAAVFGIPVSVVFLVLAIRGTDLHAVWGTLAGVRPLPLLGAVACIGVVYWVQAARWRRIADTGLGQRRFFEMVVAGVAVINVLPGRVGDLLRARWVSRGAYSGGRGLATVMLDRAFDILALVAFLLLSLPLVTDEGWVDRIVVGSIFALVVIWALILAALPAGHARGALRSSVGRARAPLVRDERARVGSLGGGRDPRGPRRRRRALARRRRLRHRGAQPGRRDPLFSRVRRHVPVARRLSACAVRDRTRGGACVRDLHAGRLVRADDDRRRGDPRRAREGRLAVGPGLRLRLLAGALSQSSPRGRWIRPSW